MEVRRTREEGLMDHGGGSETRLEWRCGDVEMGPVDVMLPFREPVIVLYCNE